MFEYLIALAGKLKQTPEWQAEEALLEKQRKFIATHFLSISSNERAIEVVRQAIVDVKPCQACKRQECPKKAWAYTFVASIDYYSDMCTLRRIADCRNTKIPVPTWQAFCEQIESAAAQSVRSTAWTAQ